MKNMKNMKPRRIIFIGVGVVKSIEIEKSR